MTDFLNDTEQEICHALTRWLRDHVDLAQQARIDQEPHSATARALWPQMLRDLELLHLEGGLRLHLRILWALGGWLSAEPYLSAGLVAHTALAAAIPEPSAQTLAAWRAGDLRLAWAHAETGHRLLHQPLCTQLHKSPQGWLLRGRKSRVSGATLATHYLVSAHSEDTGMCWLWLDAQSPGMSRRDTPGLDGQLLSELAFDDVAIPTGAVLCQGAAAEALHDRLQAHATLGVCAEAIGLLQRMMDDTLMHLRQRQQFGQPLAGFQVLQHRLADMHLALAQAQALTWAVADTFEHPDMTADARTLGVSSCKVAVGQALRSIGQGAVQLHGAMGVTEELFLARCFRRATHIQMLLGDRDQHLRRMDALLFAA